MKVSIEFQEKDKSITVQDYEFDAARVTALLNSDNINFTIEEENITKTGKLISSHYNIYADILIVTIKELE